MVSGKTAILTPWQTDVSLGPLVLTFFTSFALGEESIVENILKLVLTLFDVFC